MLHGLLISGTVRDILKQIVHDIQSYFVTDKQSNKQSIEKVCKIPCKATLCSTI